MRSAFELLLNFQDVTLHLVDLSLVELVFVLQGLAALFVSLYFLLKSQNFFYDFVLGVIGVCFHLFI
jgi:hypothetical protein